MKEKSELLVLQQVQATIEQCSPEPIIQLVTGKGSDRIINRQGCGPTGCAPSICMPNRMT